MKIGEHKSGKETFTIDGVSVRQHYYSIEWLRMAHSRSGILVATTITHRNGTISHYITEMAPA
jgi:hypothetical protein